MTNPVILDICHRHGISVDEFFGKRRGPSMRTARSEAAHEFRSRGQSWEGIARLMRRSQSAVRYLLDAKRREWSKAYMRQKWHETHKFRRVRNHAHDAAHTF